MIPMGCWARIENDKFLITGYSASLNGNENLQRTVQGDIVEAEKLTLMLVDTMIQNGAKELVAQ